VGCSELSLPSGKDGFVATNSLLAFMILLQRAYRKCADAKAEDTLTFQQIVAGHKTLDGWMNDLREASAPLWKKEHLLVLYGSRAAEAAARDMESKFTEAAIGPIQITDYRNFAHGRHHWLDKKGAETGILAFIADSDAEIAAQTLKLLPAKIPRLKFNIACQTGYTGIKAMISSLFLSGFAAEARGIDPGRPRVATFGRKIYHLNIWNRSARKPLSAIEEVAIERKTGKRVELLAPAELAHWRGAFRQFMSGLRTRAFHALVLDYDGTICDEKYRFGALPIAMSLSLNRLLKDGALIGIATGRGDSVRDALRECLHPELWNRVTVAYRNGSTISNLDSDVSEPSDPDASRRIQELAKRLEQSYALNAIATSKCRSDQINVIARHPGDSTHVYNLVCSIAAADFGSGITCVRSSHSIDILGPNLSKAAIFHTLAKTISGRRSSLICIGDLGAWPGNDYQLLGAPYSLSVLEVSQDPATCWNIAPRGVRNSQATRFFLDQLECSRSIIRFGKSKGRTPQSEP
jgi:hydroxymethylpyrimidine pyrophosphatase-like HAD family hydrolase